MPFICPKCNKDFRTKFRYGQHLKRKTPCDVIKKPHICDCGREYTRKTNLTRHVNTCEQAKQSKPILTPIVDKIVASLDEIKMELRNKPIIVNNNNITNNTNIQNLGMINVGCNINPLLKPDISIFTYDVLWRLCKDLPTLTGDPAPNARYLTGEVAQFLFSNKQFPQNLSVYADGKKIYARKEGDWEQVSREQALKSIVSGALWALTLKDPHVLDGKRDPAVIHASSIIRNYALENDAEMVHRPSDSIAIIPERNADIFANFGKLPHLAHSAQISESVAVAAPLTIEEHKQ
jgi:hypothetical protein